MIARKVGLLLSDVARYPTVADALTSMLSAKATNPADIIKVLAILVILQQNLQYVMVLFAAS